MEFVGTKRGRKRKRKRRYISNIKQRRDQLKFKVRSGKKEKLNYYLKTEKINFNTMEDYTANTFWLNYKAAHEWQERHHATWWRTRCFALEHENHVLKQTISNLVKNNYNNSLAESKEDEQQENVSNEVNDEDETLADDNLEFHLNEDMMNFLAQSIKHKIELKNKRESEEAAEIQENEDEPLEGLVYIRKRGEDAKLLYGEASSGILAMETALQATVKRHVDIAKPQYWPNIPLKL